MTTVCIVQRFDRRLPSNDREKVDEMLARLHIIDACQLLNKTRLFKHHGATLEALTEVVEH